MNLKIMKKSWPKFTIISTVSIIRNLVWDYEQKLSLFSFDNSESVEIQSIIVLMLVSSQSV